MGCHNLMVCGSALQHNGTAGLGLHVGVTGLTGRVTPIQVVLLCLATCPFRAISRHRAEEIVRTYVP
jgi:hypothetical protein